jgi:hypothetical protein
MTESVPRVMRIRCKCGKIGLMTRDEPPRISTDGTILVRFLCECPKAEVDWGNPY